MHMLTGDQIKEFGIIQKADPECFDRSNYNLRLGDEYLVVSDGEAEVAHCENNLVTIPPFGCALVSTEEWVKIPERVYGRWGLRIRAALSGLIFQAGPQIEPGYKGRLFGLLVNLSATSYRVPYLDALWSIDFTQIGAEPITAAEGEPAREDMHISGYLTTIPRGGLAQALSRVGIAQTQLKELQEWVEKQKASWQGEQMQTGAELKATIEKEMQALRLQSAKGEAERERERSARLAAEQERVATRDQMLQEAHKRIDDRKDFNKLMVVGGFFVIAAALVPVVLSKVTFDKDVIFPVLDVQKGIHEKTRRLEEEYGKFDEKLTNMNTVITQLKEEVEALRRNSPLVNTNQPGRKPPLTPSVYPR